MVPMLSTGSRDTLMSYTDRSMQRRLKSNAANVKISSETHEETHVRLLACCPYSPAGMLGKCHFVG